MKDNGVDMIKGARAAFMKSQSNLSVNQLLNAAASSHPDKEVIVDGKVRMTYKELEKEANLLASGLSMLGIGEGDRVAAGLPNWYEIVVIYFALAKIGAILVPFNYRLRMAEAEYILRNSGAKALFLPEEFDRLNQYEQFINIKNHLSSLEYLLSVRFEKENTISYQKLLEMGMQEEIDEIEIDSDNDIYTILYTSGTTGKPKGAMLTHKNIVQTAVVTADWMQCSSEDVFLMSMPLYHVMGINFLFRVIVSNASLILMDKYKPERALSLIETEKVTVHPGVPTMFILELNHPMFSSFDLSSLRTGEIGGSSCPIEIVHRIRTEMNCNILVGYGLTETSPTLTLTDFEDDDTIRSETVGKPLPGVEIKIVDDFGNEIGKDKVGELVCRSFGVMKGYYAMHEKTREAIDGDGWFYTGDLAIIDEEGYIRIIGRKQEVIKKAGFKIYPQEIEEIFLTHPNVAEAAMIGMPDSEVGEISYACLRLRRGSKNSEEELKDFIKNKLADYKVPDKIIFMEHFPRTATGKIRKIDLQCQIKSVIL
ncbi:AMP-binding protein [Schinkia azotoformans]|uniref:Long-chain acyl-CoA synthetase n=1 Tax=Schinkia azotoformans LMG 9581 TaxID=1131731 RepID=K6DIL5_SCHAZ|nr:AMP-binding protein [Schinkia azotoformans]EKN68144.1 long-chain acyl-CoA synthetase [Schinkia azotoformans LMG 9581]MEC1638046.1 AMP-binding protein [Schinkia azotoformans]MEC1946520.1 AMP-binding protein [Schinkia azotoformans]